MDKKIDLEEVERLLSLEDVQTSLLVGGGETTSTNDDIKKLASEGASHGAVVLASCQTAGRGRRGNTWNSPAGGLYMSMLLKSMLPSHMLSAVSLVVALGVSQGLTKAGCEGVGVKWPNDIVATGKNGVVGKIAGILFEVAHGVPESQKESGTALVAGIGINMVAAQTPVDRPGALAPVGIHQLAPFASREEVAASVIECVLTTFNDWVNELAMDLANPLVESVTPLSPIIGLLDKVMADAPYGVDVRDPAGNILYSADVKGLDGWGRLVVVSCSDGETKLLSSAEVSVRSKSSQ